MIINYRILTRISNEENEIAYEKMKVASVSRNMFDIVEILCNNIHIGI